MPRGGVLRVLYLFAGPHRRSDIRECLQNLAEGQAFTVEVTEVDILLHGKADDLASDDVWSRLLQEIAGGNFDIIIASPPCHTHSRALERAGPGPKPLRSRLHPRGLPWLSGQRLAKVTLANKLIDRTFEAIRTGHASPSRARFLLEHPEDLGAVRGGGDPASIWQLQAVQDIIQETGATWGALH